MPKIPKDLPLIEGHVGKPVDTPEGKKHVMEALAIVLDQYSPEMAMAVERIWRKETAHFKAGFTKTNGAGMHPWAETFPWGWRDLEAAWSNIPQFRPVAYTYMTEGGTGKKLPYLVFATPKAFALSLAALLDTRMKKHGWSLRRAMGSWFSSLAPMALKYAKDAEKITPAFTNEILAAGKTFGAVGEEP